VADGHIYVARPPLYKVTEKKKVRFVQTIEAMQQELVESGLRGTRLAIHPPPADGTPTPPPRLLEGGELAALVQAQTRLEEALQTLERRGLSLTTFLPRATERGLPFFRVQLGGQEKWFWTQDEVDAFCHAEQQRLGRELVVGDEVGTNGHVNGSADVVHIQELHEVREVNAGLQRLREHGLAASDLVPPVRVAGREPPLRLVLENGDQRKALTTLRELPSEVRRLGERGRVITRFKGLGEMDPEELWDTTLDPEKRTLMRVQLDDALKADELFRILMGEKVEPRRDFIQKNALEAREIDYHGA
jgi:DNA gyrase subunit B